MFSLSSCGTCVTTEASGLLLRQVISPGGQNVVTGPDGADWLVYHSKEPTIPGLDRRVCIAPITWTSSGPTTFTSYRVPELSQ